MLTLQIEASQLEEIKEIIKKIYPSAVVWAYGSRVTGQSHEGSDLDLVIVDFGTPTHNMASIKNAFTESNIPILVDIRSWTQLPRSFQEEILKQYIPILP